MNGAFIPAWWLPGPHAQTLWGSLARNTPQLARRRERVILSDGDFIDLDWYEATPQAPIVLIAHGLTGSSQSHYVLGLQQQLKRVGLSSVALNWRGCSGEPNLLPRGYHSGVSEDLAELIAHLRAQHPSQPLLAVGYSLGGNVLLKYLGEQGATCPLTGAVAVSVPFRLDQCADRVKLGFSKIYQKHFMKELNHYLNAKQRQFAEHGQWQHFETLKKLGPLQKMETFWDFDGQVTAPLHGFADAQDYYRRASSRYLLGQIRTPCLLIQALDDPFVFRHSIPEPQELSATTQLELHRHGGHVGFISGSVRAPQFYLEQRIPQALIQMLASGT